MIACGILAGGSGTRLGGVEKALLDINGRPLLAHLIERLKPNFGPILLSTNSPELYAWTGLHCVADILPYKCPLSGLHALLKNLPIALVIGCDMPGVSAKLMDRLLSEKGDVILPVSPTGDEPLHAIYSSTCIAAIEHAAGAGRLKMTDFLPDVMTTRVKIDPAGYTDGPLPPFFNINSPADLDIVRRTS